MLHIGTSCPGSPTTRTSDARLHVIRPRAAVLTRSRCHSESISRGSAPTQSGASSDAPSTVVHRVGRGDSSLILWLTRLILARPVNLTVPSSLSATRCTGPKRLNGLQDLPTSQNDPDRPTEIKSACAKFLTVKNYYGECRLWGLSAALENEVLQDVVTMTERPFSWGPGAI